MSALVVVAQLKGAPVPRPWVESLTATLRDRGPDGTGVWHAGSVGLGHALHAVSVDGDRKPGPYGLDERLFVTADARIDDRETLRAQLRALGVHASADATDCQLILHAYSAWGEHCCEHLLGDFSFALWDAPRRKLICAVDQLGVKPFFYAERDGLFVGSSALDTVRAHPGARDELDEIAVGDYLLFGCYQTRDITIYADIRRVPPGHVLVVEDGRVRLQRYFTLPEPTELRLPRAQDYVEQLQELLCAAVRDRLRTPRVAVFMSGGVDSPLVAKVAKNQLAKDYRDHELRAFTGVFDRLIPDQERRFAALAAQSLGIPIDIQPLDDGTLFDWIGRLTLPQPPEVAAFVPWLEQLSRLGERHAVALTGWDGDALLAGEVRWHWLERLRAGRYGEMARELKWYVAHERALPPVGLRTALSRWSSRGAVRPLPKGLQPELARRTALFERWTQWHSPLETSGSRGRAHQLLGAPPWGWLLDSFDRSRLPLPLEVRHPMMDLRVLRFGLSLPAVPWCVHKHALRACLADLPEALRSRPKTPLRSEPLRELFPSRGLGSASDRWQSPVLAPFVDTPLVAEVLASARGGEEDLAVWLRTVSLGAWWRSRPAAPTLPGTGACPGAAAPC